MRFPVIAVCLSVFPLPPPFLAADSAQCIPAPLATPIPVSDDAAPSSLSPSMPPETPESPGQGLAGSVQFSVPVSEHMGDCGVISEDLDSLLDCLPKGSEVSSVSNLAMVPLHHHPRTQDGRAERKRKRTSWVGLGVGGSEGKEQEAKNGE